MWNRRSALFPTRPFLRRSGVVVASTTAWGLVCIYGTEPSTLGRVVPAHRLIFVWSAMLVVGGLLFLSASELGALRRLEAEREAAPAG